MVEESNVLLSFQIKGFRLNKRVGGPRDPFNHAYGKFPVQTDGNHQRQIDPALPPAKQKPARSNTLHFPPWLLVPVWGDQPNRPLPHDVTSLDLPGYNKYVEIKQYVKPSVSSAGSCGDVRLSMRADSQS